MLTDSNGSRIAAKNFRFFTAAASDNEGVGELHIPIYDGNDAGMASLHEITIAEENLAFGEPPRRLDNLLVDESRFISFLKIDVEGHESSLVIRGAPHVVSTRPALLVEIEERHHDDPIYDVFEEVAALGYQGWALFKNGLRPIESFDLDRDQRSFLTSEFQHAMDPAYVNDFLFLATGLLPPMELMDSSFG